MALYNVRIEQRIERVVQVEAFSPAQAREMAERGEGAWFDSGKGESVGVEALEAERDSSGEVDDMEEWKARIEA